MNTVSEETVEDGGYPIRKSVSSGGSGSTVSGGKTRRNSIGVTSSRKSVGEEGNSVPNYLRASTGSCHDFCKFGKHTEHTKSAIPIKFKRSTVVNKEKVMKTVVPVEIKKTAQVKKLEPPTYPKIRIAAEPVEVTKMVVSVPSKKAQVSKPVLSTNGKATENVVKTFKRSTSCAQPSRVTVNHGASAGSNGVIKKKDITTVKKTEVTPKTAPVKKVPTESHSQKASFRRAASLKETAYRSVKQVAPLKDQNRLQKTKPKKSSFDKIQTNNLHGVEASEVKPETMEFDFIHPTMELISDSVCNSSESFSGKDIVEEESTVIHPVYESSELFLDKHLLEESLINESSELLQEPLMELVNDPVCNSSESFSGENVLEQKSTIIHPVYDSSELVSNKEILEGALIAESSELFEEKEFLEEESLIAHPVVESSQSNSEKDFLEEETLVAPPVVESRQSNSEKEFLEEELLIAHPVVESSQSNSEKEFVQESLIVPSLSESSESFYDEEVVLEDESDYTDDEEEVESENTDNLKVCATTNGDEMETTKKISRKGRMVISEDKDDEAVKLRFRRGKILDLQAEKNNSPRRLKFRRGKVVEGKDVKQHISKRTFEKKSAEEIDDSNPARESVVLKHQGEQEKKDAQGLFNNVIEETATKLAETRKSKVKALVGAFETVISLQDGKP